MTVFLNFLANKFGKIKDLEHPFLHDLLIFLFKDRIILNKMISLHLLYISLYRQNFRIY